MFKLNFPNVDTLCIRFFVSECLVGTFFEVIKNSCEIKVLTVNSTLYNFTRFHMTYTSTEVVKALVFNVVLSIMSMFYFTHHFMPQLFLTPSNIMVIVGDQLLLCFLFLIIRRHSFKID